MSFRVVAITDESWQQFRDLRLEMLADSPSAFGETLSAASRESDERWKQRTHETNSASSCGFAAVDDTGRWLGIMRVRIEEGETFLLGVYVTPHRRGEGIADALLAGIERWARAQGRVRLTLEVHEGNERAQAFYRRLGFTETGEIVPYPLAPGENEYVMTKPLSAT